MFRRMTINDWRQFGTVDIELHPRLTILTGANGAGKTTLLNVLNQHFGWSMPLLSTPTWLRGVLLYLPGLLKRFENESVHTIGSLEYSNGVTAELWVPTTVGEQFNISISNQQGVEGINIPSHRPPYLYQRIDNIPVAPPQKQQMFNVHRQEAFYRFNVNQPVKSGSFRIRENLISLATFGYGNQAVERNEESVQIYEGFQRILREVLPTSLGFQRLRVRVPEVVLETRTGDFQFDAVSGGIAAIIELAWQIYLASLLWSEFVVVIDEPENHLHPELQRIFFPNLLESFPTAQFVTATHNPFIVSSVPESNVYVLDYDREHRVNSEYLDTVNKAGSANEVLRDALGIDFTMPLWVERRLDVIVERYGSEPLSHETARGLRAEMEELGLSYLFPDVLSRVVDQTDDSSE